MSEDKEDRLLVYQEWYEYYIQSGYNAGASRRYATLQSEKGLRLADYSDDPAKAGRPTATAVAPIKREKNPYAGLNAILALGSFFLVGGLLTMINRIDDDMMPGLFIFIIALFTGLGAFLYQRVEKLKPVGMCFMITSLVLLPFSLDAFERLVAPLQKDTWLFDGAEAFAAILWSAFVTLNLVVNTIITKKRGFGVATFIAFYYMLLNIGTYLAFKGLAQSMEPWRLQTGPGGIQMNLENGANIVREVVTGRNYRLQFYWNYLAPFAISFFATYCYLKKPKWLPEGFQDGVKAVYCSAPFVGGIVTMLILMATGFNGQPYFYDTGMIAPFVMTIWAALELARQVLAYVLQRSEKHAVTIRFGAQMFVMMLCCDLFMPQFTDSVFTEKAFLPAFTPGNTFLLIPILWVVLSCAQCLASLFLSAKVRDNEARSTAEQSVGIASLVAIGLSPFVMNCWAGAIDFNVTILVMLAIVAVLGSCYAVVRKNSSWFFAPAVAILIMPFPIAELAYGDAFTGLTDRLQLLFNCFTIIALLAIGVQWLFARYNVEKGEKISMLLAVASIPILAICALNTDGQPPLWLGLIVGAVSTLSISFLSKEHDTLLEIGMYLTGTAISAWVFDLFDLYAECDSLAGCSAATLDLRKFIVAHILGLTLLATAYFFEYRKQKRFGNRLLLGYIIYALTVGLVSAYARVERGSIGIGLIHVLENAAVVGWAFWRQNKPLATFSSIATVFSTIFVLGLFEDSYTWLLVFGFALIAFVVWRLTGPTKNKGEQKSP